MIKLENPINGRYYYLTIHRDLFNDYCLSVFRGGPLRSVRHIRCMVSRKLAKQEVRRLVALRLQRGYLLVSLNRKVSVI